MAALLALKPSISLKSLKVPQLGQSTQSSVGRVCCKVFYPALALSANDIGTGMSVGRPCSLTGLSKPAARHNRSARFLGQPRAVSEETSEPITAEETVEEASGNGGEESTSAQDLSDLLREYKERVLAYDEDAVNEIEKVLMTAVQGSGGLEKQVTSLTEEVGLSKDRFLRLNADFDNFRKRSEQEKAALAVNIRARVLEDLLPMIDNFERAKTSIKAQTEGETKIDNSYQGIYKQFVEAMKSMGVTAVETNGKEFDPAVHEAIMREESNEFEEGMVVQEFRKGFLIGEKLLRPSMVKVSAGPGPSQDGPATQVEPVEAEAEAAAAATAAADEAQA
eukprot:jgi/Mesen1/7943/ME000422S07095